VWAGSIIVRIGHQRDVLVGVQADSYESLVMLRELFANWLDDSIADELADTNPAFKVHLTPAPTGTRGTRTLPHLRYGSDVLARSTDPTDVLQALASVLGGIHERRPNDGRAWVNLRSFVVDGAVVLASVERPHLVADKQLIAAGVTERVNWGVEVHADRGTISIPSHLPGLAWPDGAPAESGESPLAGAVVFDTEADTVGSLLAALATASVHPAWFTTAQHLAEGGRVSNARDRRSAAAQVLRHRP
jgi:hypothetical protein